MAMIKTILRAALYGSLFCLVTTVGAQQAFDPMRPAHNPLGPAVPTPDPDAVDDVPNPELGNLPDGIGAEETYYQCVACHSTSIIIQQELSDARWDYLWTWMVDEQGMYEPDDETRDLILDYLKTHFSSER